MTTTMSQHPSVLHHNTQHFSPGESVQWLTIRDGHRLLSHKTSSIVFARSFMLAEVAQPRNTARIIAVAESRPCSARGQLSRPTPERIPALFFCRAHVLWNSLLLPSLTQHGNCSEVFAVSGSLYYGRPLVGKLGLMRTMLRYKSHDSPQGSLKTGYLNGIVLYLFLNRFPCRVVPVLSESSSSSSVSNARSARTGIATAGTISRI
jgi:hypothetical protein